MTKKILNEKCRTIEREDKRRELRSRRVKNKIVKLTQRNVIRITLQNEPNVREL